MCGVITLGDIVKALVEGKTIYAPIEKLVKPSYIYLTEVDFQEAFHIFQSKNISLIPVLDENGYLKSVITPRDIMRFASFHIDP